MATNASMAVAQLQMTTAHQLVRLFSPTCKIRFGSLTLPGGRSDAKMRSYFPISGSWTRREQGFWQDVVQATQPRENKKYGRKP